MSIIVVAAALLAVGRMTLYRGYPRGAAARAFGMVTTVVPTMFVLALSLVALVGNEITP